MFVETDHVYRTACMLQWSLLALPFVYATHNRATAAKHAR